MKARKTDEKTKSRNTQSEASAKQSSGEQQSAGGGQDHVQANQHGNGPRGREDSSIRGRESGQVRGEDAAASGQEQEISNRGSFQEEQRQQKVAPGPCQN